MAGSKTSKVVPAPGAMTSPQIPGMVPDWTSVPTHIGESTPPAATRVRPLTQYGSAEELSSVFTRKSMDEIQPEDFEQATASYEELRKANPDDLTPIRPAPAFRAEIGISPGDATKEISSGE